MLPLKGEFSSSSSKNNSHVYKYKVKKANESIDHTNNICTYRQGQHRKISKGLNSIDRCSCSLILILKEVALFLVQFLRGTDIINNLADQSFLSLVDTTHTTELENYSVISYSSLLLEKNIRNDLGNFNELNYEVRLWKILFLFTNSNIVVFKYIRKQCCYNTLVGPWQIYRIRRFHTIMALKREAIDQSIR